MMSSRVAPAERSFSARARRSAVAVRRRSVCRLGTVTSSAEVHRLPGGRQDWLVAYVFLIAPTNHVGVLWVKFYRRNPHPQRVFGKKGRPRTRERLIHEATRGTRVGQHRLDQRDRLHRRMVKAACRLGDFEHRGLRVVAEPAFTAATAPPTVAGGVPVEDR